MERGAIEKLVLEKKSTREIALILNTSQTNIRYWLKKNQLKTNPEKPYKCKCGETDPSKFYGHKKNICGRCHNQYVIKTGKIKMKKARDYLGGKCVNPNCPGCIYESALQIHHLDPAKKDEKFSSKRSWSWSRLKKEIKDCILLCGNCHAGIHNNEWKYGV